MEFVSNKKYVNVIVVKFILKNKQLKYIKYIFKYNFICTVMFINLFLCYFVIDSLFESIKMIKAKKIDESTTLKYINAKLTQIY